LAARGSYDPGVGAYRHTTNPARDLQQTSAASARRPLSARSAWWLETRSAPDWSG